MRPSQIRATQKYVKENYDRVVVTMPKGERDVFKAAAEAAGESLNHYFYESVKMRMKSENQN